MNGLLVALVGGVGVFYLYTATVMRWRGLAPAPSPLADSAPPKSGLRDWLIQAGLEGVEPVQFAIVLVSVFVLGAAVGFAIFGTVVPAVLIGGFAASVPVASYRVRRRQRQALAHEAWPHIIEEIRILTGAAGRSVPQALFQAGQNAPEGMRPAFEAASREWLITTDFDRTLTVLKARLADPTADIVAETLLIAHHLGGTDLQQRLEALADDRITDVQARKDAVARQSGVRFARWFTVLVPMGMALVGMSIGDGRASYRTATGQVLVVVAILLMILCWMWASAIMRLPEDERVFPE